MVIRPNALLWPEPAFAFHTTISSLHPCSTDFSRKTFFLLKFPWLSSVNILREGCFSISGKLILDGFKSKTTISWNLFHETTYLNSYLRKKINREVWKKNGRNCMSFPLFSHSEEHWASCRQLLHTASSHAAALLLMFAFVYVICSGFEQGFTYNIDWEKCVRRK